MGHPEDTAMGEQPERFDEFTGGYTAAEHDRAMDRILADIRKDIAHINKNIDGTPHGTGRTPSGATDGLVPLSNVRPVNSPALVDAYARLGRVLVTGSREQTDAAISDIVAAAKGVR